MFCMRLRDLIESCQNCQVLVEVPSTSPDLQQVAGRGLDPAQRMHGTHAGAAALRTQVRRRCCRAAGNAHWLSDEVARRSSTWTVQERLCIAWNVVREHYRLAWGSLRLLVA